MSETENRGNVISMYKFKKDILFQNYAVSTNVLLFNNKETLLTKKRFYDDAHLNLYANYIKVRADENYLYVFYPNTGNFIKYDKNYKIIQEVDVTEIFKLKKNKLQKIGNKIKQNRIYNDFFLFGETVMFYKNFSKDQDTFTEIQPLNLQNRKPIKPIIIQKELQYINKFSDKYLALEDDKILILKINLLD